MPAPIPDESPLDYLTSVYLDEQQKTVDRVAAAAALLPFTIQPLMPLDDGDGASVPAMQ